MIEYKQAILIRTDLDMSPGKVGAQCAHASVKAVMDHNFDGDPLFTKVVLKVRNEHALLAHYNRAKDAGLPCSLVKDEARTELKEPAFTVVAIGPCCSEKLAKITKRLRLLLR